MNFLQRQVILKIIYAIIGLALLYFITSFFVAFTIHGMIDTDVNKITSGVEGYIKQVYVLDNQLVNKGQLLLEIDPTPYKLAVDAAQSIFEQAKLQADLARDNVASVKFTVDGSTNRVAQTKASMLRNQALLKSQNISPDAFERIRLEYQLAYDELKRNELALQTAQHELELREKAAAEKEADLNTAKYQLSLTKLYAPQSGYITNLRFYNNDYVTKGEMLFGLIDNTAWRVVGYFYENELRSMKPNQTVFISLMSNPWRIYRGHIQSISRGVARNDTARDVSLSYTPPVMGWFTNIYYFPVRIKIDHAEKLPLYVGANARALVLY